MMMCRSPGPGAGAAATPEIIRGSQEPLGMLAARCTLTGRSAANERIRERGGRIDPWIVAPELERPEQALSHRPARSVHCRKPLQTPALKRPTPHALWPLVSREPDGRHRNPQRRAGPMQVDVEHTLFEDEQEFFRRQPSDSVELVHQHDCIWLDANKQIAKVNWCGEALAGRRRWGRRGPLTRGLGRMPELA
jgi:hypothetical protein